jgi:hypothetical protein
VADGDIHLLAAENESLLNWGDTLLLLDALLYPGDLFPPKNVSLRDSRCVELGAELMVSSSDEAFPARGSRRYTGVVSLTLYSGSISSSISLPVSVRTLKVENVSRQVALGVPRLGPTMMQL